MADDKTELEQLRAELAEIQGGLADEGKASECIDTDDRVAGVLQRIREITGEPTAR